MVIKHTPLTDTDLPIPKTGYANALAPMTFTVKDIDAGQVPLPALGCQDR